MSLFKMKRTISTIIQIPGKESTIVLELAKNMTPPDILAYLKNVVNVAVKEDSLVLTKENDKQITVMSENTHLDEVSNGLSSKIIIVPPEFNLRIFSPSEKYVDITFPVMSATYSLIDQVCSQWGLQDSNSYELYLSKEDDLIHSFRRSLTLIENTQSERPLYLKRRWWWSDTADSVGQKELEFLFEQAKNTFFSLEDHEKFDFIELVAISAVVHFKHNVDEAKAAAKKKGPDAFFPSYIEGFFMTRKVFSTFNDLKKKDDMELMRRFINLLIEKDPYIFCTRVQALLNESRKKRYICFHNADVLILKSDKTTILQTIPQSKVHKWKLHPPKGLQLIYGTEKQVGESKLDKINFSVDNLKLAIAHVSDYTQYITPIIKSRINKKKRDSYIQKTQRLQLSIPVSQRTKTISIPSLAKDTLSMFDPPTPQKHIAVCIPMTPRSIISEKTVTDESFSITKINPEDAKIDVAAINLFTKIDKSESIIGTEDIEQFLKESCPEAKVELDFVQLIPKGNYMEGLAAAARIALSIIWKYSPSDGARYAGLHKLSEVIISSASKHSKNYSFNDLILSVSKKKVYPASTVMFSLICELQSSHAQCLLTLFFVALNAAFLANTILMPENKRKEALKSQIFGAVPPFDAVAAYQVYQQTKNENDFCSKCLRKMLRNIESPIIISTLFTWNSLERFEEPENILDATYLFEYLKVISLALFFVPDGQCYSSELSSASSSMLRAAYADPDSKRQAFDYLQSVIKNTVSFVTTKETFKSILVPCTPLTSFIHCLMEKREAEISDAESSVFEEMIELDNEPDSSSALKPLQEKKKSLLEAISSDDKDKANHEMSDFVFLYLCAKKKLKSEDATNNKNKKETPNSEWETSIFSDIINTVTTFLMWKNDKMSTEEVLRLLEIA